MLDDALTDAVNSLAKQLRSIDASIRQESKVIESVKKRLKATRAEGAEVEEAIARHVDDVAALKLRKFLSIDQGQSIVLRQKQIAQDRLDSRRGEVRDMRKNLFSRVNSFMRDSKRYQSGLDSREIQQSMDSADKVCKAHDSDVPRLEERESRAAAEAANLEKETQKFAVQLENLEEYISWLREAMVKMREERDDVDEQMALRRREQRESAEESIVAADILAHQHEKQLLQDRIDVLVMEHMHEQEEIAKLRKAFDHVAPLGSSRSNHQAPRFHSSAQSIHPGPTFVTARNLLPAHEQDKPRQARRKPRTAPPSAAKERQKAPGSSKDQKNHKPKHQNHAAGASQSFVDVFGGRKFTHG
ncbi:hypothetical protein HOP50_06g43120 [Chloropicon primus]|nr:hypothetical protein HOP50_06g43120 [Chloropicon primus]